LEDIFWHAVCHVNVKPKKLFEQKMKQMLFSALLLGATSSISLAQVTLTAATSNPVQGDVYYNHTWDTTGIREGAAGANVTWNFTAATDLGIIDSTKFYSCTSGVCDTFPGSTVYGASSYDTTFFITNASRFSLNGVQSRFGNIKYSNPLDILRYPLTYNTAFVDTSLLTQSAFMTRIWQADSMICDGWGTLRLPGRTVTGVLRVRNISYSRDSSFGVRESRSESIMWLKPGYHMPILSIYYDTDGGSRYVSDVFYFTGTFRSTSVGSVSTITSNLSVFPNPATDNITLSFTSSYGEPESISIFDMTGREVLTQTLTNLNNGENKVTISTAQLVAGNYIVKKSSASGVVTSILCIKK
jgi:hypothetical protein